MKFKHYFHLLLVAILFVGEARATEIPLQDFFRNSEKTAFTISPDGQNIAYLARWQSRMNIMLRKPGQVDKRMTENTDRDLSIYGWKGNQSIIYLKDKDGDENFHLYRVDLDSGITTDLTPFEGARTLIIDWLPLLGDEILVAINKQDHQNFDAYRLNIRTGELKLEVASRDRTYAWLADHAGVIRIISNSDGSILYREKADQQFKVMERFVGTSNSLFGHRFIPLAFAADNQHIYVRTNVDRDKEVLIEYDPVARKELKQIYAHPDVDVGGVTFSAQRKVLECIYAETSKFERICLDEKSRQLYKKLEEKLPDYWLNITSSSVNEDRLIVQARNDRQAGKFYLYDVMTDELKELGVQRPWLKENTLAKVEPIQYQSRDGLTIHGYLTLPPGKESAKNLPVIINPHGGPQYRDYWGYNGEAQFLANRGWAVMQMNFRGSSGYGKKFLSAGAKEWGGKMQDDITDGVNWLIKTGRADPQKICIYGASYGGFATLSGITKTPDLYRCAVDYVGISNLFTFLETIPPYWSKPYWLEMVGDPNRDYFMLKARSPLFNVDKIKTPLLVLHGAKDPRVNINEAKQIVDALKKRNIDVELIVKDNEGHGFRNEENQLSAYQAMELFFKRNLN